MADITWEVGVNITALCDDGSRYVTCTPMLRREDGTYEAITAFHLGPGGELLGVLLASKGGSEEEVTPEGTYSLPEFSKLFTFLAPEESQ